MSLLFVNVGDDATVGADTSGAKKPVTRIILSSAWIGLTGS